MALSARIPAERWAQPGTLSWCGLEYSLDDPPEVEGADEQRLAAFRRTEMEVTSRLRPFVEVAIRAARRAPRPAHDLG